MTAIVSREHARVTGLTATAGLLVLAVAVVLMIVAAPAQAHRQPAGPAVTQLTSDPCHNLTSRSDPTAARACLAGPWAVSA